MWNLIYNNYSCSEKETFKSYQKLFEKLLTVKSKLNNKASETPIFLKCKASLKEHKKDEERKITKINNLLNTKIQSVMNSPSKYSQRLSSPKYCPAFDKQLLLFSLKEKFVLLFFSITKLFLNELLLLISDKVVLFISSNLLNKMAESLIKFDLKSPKVRNLRDTFGRNLDLEIFFLIYCS